MTIDVVFWITFGALLGWISSVVAGSENIYTNVALGILGAILGGVFTTRIGGELEDFTIISLLTAKSWGRSLCWLSPKPCARIGTYHKESCEENGRQKPGSLKHDRFVVRRFGAVNYIHAARLLAAFYTATTYSATPTA